MRHLTKTLVCPYQVYPWDEVWAWFALPRQSDALLCCAWQPAAAFSCEAFDVGKHS